MDSIQGQALNGWDVLVVVIVFVLWGAVVRLMYGRNESNGRR